LRRTPGTESAPEVEAAVSILLVHMVNVAADAALAAGADRLGLLGTAPVMQEEVYLSRFAARGIEVILLTRPVRPIRVPSHQFLA